MSAEPHLVADRYRLDERIGSGGMGVVWRAHDILLNRTVAVKQLLLGPGLSPGDADESRARAMREGRIAARLQHPHAINVFDVALGPDLEGGEDSQPWLVMEYLPSRSLADVLAEQGPLDPREVARIGRQIADALTAAHGAGIVHRDVKPGNVLLGKNGTVKITDFGISRASWDVTVTRTGVLSGTPAYFAPEVARGETPDPASDVFSLGSTLYTAVEGTPLFEIDDNPLALLRSVADGKVRPPQNAGPLSALLMLLLRYDPAQRPVMVVARDMLGAIATEGSEKHATVAMSSAADSSPRQITRSAARPLVATPAAATGTREDAPPARPPADRPPAARPPAARLAAARRPWWRRRRVLAGAAALLLLVALGAVVLATTLDDKPDNPSTAATATSLATEPAITTTPAPSPEASTTTPEPTTTPPPPAEPGPAEYEQAVRDYYGLLPAQLDEAYSYLGPDVQEQSNGRDGFESYWSQYSEVEADNVAAEGTTVTLTIVYTRLDGSTLTEPYVLEMGTAADDGRILILSSRYGGSG